MQPFFEKRMSATYAGEKTPEDIMRLIANRYINDNPVRPYISRAFHEDGFNQEFGGRYILDFDEKFPDAPEGSYAYAFATLWNENDDGCCLSLSCKSPVWVYANGTLQTQTNCLDEASDNRRDVGFLLNKGANSIFIKAKKNRLGFACRIGCQNPKWVPVNFYCGFSDNAGALGWNYAGPFEEDCVAPPEPNEKMSDIWMPKPDDNDMGSTLYNQSCGYGVTNLHVDMPDVAVKLSGTINGHGNIFVDNKSVFDGEGEFDIEIPLSGGVHVLAVKMQRKNGQMDFSLGEIKNGYIKLPAGVIGTTGHWVYLAGNDDRALMGFDPYLSANGDQGQDYWKVGKHTVVRPVLENECYGKWNYPLGVAMYGLLVTAHMLNDKQILDYALSHILSCSKIHEYALWDQKKYGFACVNHQLQALDALDDCGSFGSAMLEGYKDAPDDSIRFVADIIADYITNRQERLDDGTFYREMPGHHFENTIWADDLYMSTPFLCRYYQLTGDIKYLNDAAKQFINFRKYLFMEDEKLMSHVYNLNYGKKTGIPWGRGNGWVAFSLSEILSCMPSDHPDRPQLLDFFRTFCSRLITLQDENGMWHQVLTDETSYAESSCTAMYVCAFARGIRNGWLDDPEYAHAAIRGWNALAEYAVDRTGNLYGVCVGSGYSFRPEYYRDELPWRINDVHGTGIVLIAGAEVIKLINGDSV